jgi:hypothetical protein
VDEQDCLPSFACHEIMDTVGAELREVRFGLRLRVDWFTTLGRAGAAGNDKETRDRSGGIEGFNHILVMHDA